MPEVHVSLEPLTPANGVERYLRRRRSEVAAGTCREYERKLDYFIEYCECNEITNVNELNGRIVDDFQVWRREDSSDQVDQLGAKTMRDDMYLFRSFLDYLASIEAVKPTLPDLIDIPELGPKDGVRDIEMPPERAERILNHLETFKYGHREHVVWLLYCRTGRRPRCIHSLDVADVQEESGGPYLRFRHRPDKGTELKNDDRSEGDVAISEPVKVVLDDYLENCRKEVTDDHERQPLITSQYGRLARSTMRRYLYKWSRPCQITGDCPHDRTIEECSAAASLDEASKCPSSLPPYAIRHGYITDLRRKGALTSLVSDRCDVSEEIIKKHYDERSEADRRKLQRKLMANIAEDADEESGGYVD